MTSSTNTPPTSGKSAGASRTEMLQVVTDDYVDDVVEIDELDITVDKTVGVYAQGDDETDLSFF